MNKGKFHTLPPSGFDTPDALPENDALTLEWQKKNKEWWEKTPMKYDWNSTVSFPSGSKEYYDEIDKRFFSIAEDFAPRKWVPFDTIIDFDAIKNKNVLEIGVGNGTHAELLSTYSKSFTGIDLTSFASEAVNQRFKIKNLKGEVLQMDAEKMGFEDGEFDFVWSWGVIHHSANTKKILNEIHRVLAPNGKATIMVYHKSFWYYYVVNGFFRGIILGKLFKLKSIHAVVQYYTDGAIARYYTEDEWSTLCGDNFKVDRMEIYGQKLELFPIPYSRFKVFLANLVPSAVTRFFLNRLKFGSLLVAHMTKI